MTNNPYESKSREELADLMRTGVECSKCAGAGVSDAPYQSDYETPVNCIPCSGSGRVPMANADLDALVAKWCWGEEVVWLEDEKSIMHRIPHGAGWYIVRDGRKLRLNGVGGCDYTTDPADAMRLQVKYDIDTTHVGSSRQSPDHAWFAKAWVDLPEEDFVLCPKCEEDDEVCGYVQFPEKTSEADKTKALCLAITKAALIKVLTEALEDRK